jgi:protein O-mannosyl-transferase
MLKSDIKYIYLSILLFLTVLVYLNIFENEFTWDDKSFIVEWQEIKSFENFGKFLQGIVPVGHSGVYRPVRTIFYAISYGIWGLNPFGYHLQSLLIHLSATILIFYISCHIVKNNKIAFLASLIFGVHPIHTESITVMTSSFDTLGIVFFLASFYTYILYEDNKNILIISLFFAALAFFTYELTLTLPLLFILYDFCIRKNLKKKPYLWYFSILIFYFIVRQSILQKIGRENYLVIASISLC